MDFVTECKCIIKPSDQNACYCNLLLENNLSKTEDGEYFEKNMIIFRSII